MMGISLGAVLEPGIVVCLLFGGAWVNRNQQYRLTFSAKHSTDSEQGPGRRRGGRASAESSSSWLTGSGSDSVTSSNVNPTSGWRPREFKLWRLRRTIHAPATAQYEQRLLSRVLRKFPFLVEAFYWALIYFVSVIADCSSPNKETRSPSNIYKTQVYQVARAIAALTIVEGTVQAALRNALSIIHLEQKLGIFWEPGIQQFFIRHTFMMHWLNRIYSFIHIPATIAFLVWLYWYTSSQAPSSPSLHSPVPSTPRASQGLYPLDQPLRSQTSHLRRTYEARRRTMALCNLLAFIVFTAWPCMPPRLLGDPNNKPGPDATFGKAFGFVDTVHGQDAASSVWTTNRFCNQYAAMPSLHFGYSLLIGMTIATLPLARRSGGDGKDRRSVRLKGLVLRVRAPSARRILCVAVGFLYPFTILVAIVATANHFILDAVAGAVVCAVAWHANRVILNLLPLQDWFLWLIGTSFPASVGEEDRTKEMWLDDDFDEVMGEANYLAPQDLDGVGKWAA